MHQNVDFVVNNQITAETKTILPIIQDEQLGELGVKQHEPSPRSANKQNRIPKTEATRKPKETNPQDNNTNKLHEKNLFQLGFTLEIIIIS